MKYIGLSNRQEMSGPCSMHESGEKIRHFSWNTSREKSLERSRHHWDDYMEIILKHPHPPRI
jgi:hypothetical protein